MLILLDAELNPPAMILDVSIGIHDTAAPEEPHVIWAKRFFPELF